MCFTNTSWQPYQEHLRLVGCPTALSHLNSRTHLCNLRNNFNALSSPISCSNSLLTWSSRLFEKYLIVATGALGKSLPKKIWPGLAKERRRPNIRGVPDSAVSK